MECAPMARASSLSSLHETPRVAGWQSTMGAYRMSIARFSVFIVISNTTFRALASR
jgi:hypothetical protein